MGKGQLFQIPCHQVLELVDEEGGRQRGNPSMWDRDQLPDRHISDYHQMRSLSCMFYHI